MRRAAAILVPICLLVGLVASGLLFARHLDLLQHADAARDVCSTLFGRGCDDVLLDPASSVAGLPLAGWGLLYFGGVLLVLFLGLLFDDTFRRTTRALVSVCLLVGAVLSLWLLGRLFTGGLAVCPLCVVAHVGNLVALPLHLLGRPSAFREDVRTLVNGLGYAVGRPPADRLAARWRALGLLFVLLAVGAAWQRMLMEIQAHPAEVARSDPQSILRRFQAAPRANLPLRGDEAFLGSETARVDLVVFGDAFCTHCSAFWDARDELVARYGEDVRIVFKHFPIEKACNLGIAVTRHPRACEAAYAMEAARRQDRFWEFYEALSATQVPDRPDAVVDAAARAGLDVGRFEKDLADPSTRRAVEDDVALGRRLGIDGTPSFVLDGRRIRDPRLSSLRVVLDGLLGRPQSSER